MSTPSRTAAKCDIVGGEKLPAQSGGPKALCAAIERAMAERVPGTKVTAEVRVLSPSRLRATLRTDDGRVLDDQNYASSDRALSRASFDRFAVGLAEALRKKAAR